MLLIVQKDQDGNLSIADTKPSFPCFLLIGEELSYYKEDNKDCIEITAIFNDFSLEETIFFFDSDSTRNFIVPPDIQITICTVTIKKMFSRGLKNLFDSCSRETESQIYINIKKIFFSSSESRIRQNDLCTNSPLNIFEKTNSLSIYLNKIQELIAKI